MNHRLAALVLPLALAGCATLGRGSSDEGLRARMSNRGYGVGVKLSEPAHVAIFEVVSGGRARLLYPWPGADPSPVGGSLYFPGTAITGYALGARPRWRATLLYVIASRRPLDQDFIREFQNGPGAIDGELLPAGSPAETLEFLASRVVAGQPDEDWAADVMRVRNPLRAIHYAGGGSSGSSGSSSGYTDTCPLSGQTSMSGHICDRPVVNRPAPPPPLPGSPAGSPPERPGRQP